MADKGPNYTVERRRLEIQQLEHRQLIQKQHGRLEEIASSKDMNTARAELANMELDAEADSIRLNQASLEVRINEINKNLGVMVKQEKGE